MITTYFDIETGPLPDAEIESLLPPFDVADVKVGNIKDEAKIKEKIAAAERSHRERFFADAALNPMTGQVLAIGIREDGQFRMLEGDERLVLALFWELFVNSSRMVGFNIFQFDLPFLVKRSWKHHQIVPGNVRNGRYFGSTFQDMRDVWQMGDRHATGSLDAIARFLGVGQKLGDGAQFAALFKSDRAAAIRYLENDVLLVEKIANALYFA